MQLLQDSFPDREGDKTCHPAGKTRFHKFDAKTEKAQGLHRRTGWLLQPRASLSSASRSFTENGRETIASGTGLEGEGSGEVRGSEEKKGRREGARQRIGDVKMVNSGLM